ncbi:hypothetical protein ACFV47_17295, partial [Streptomyces solisilvae]|uniref:hypothetical protein n=1 Tax=Streptomyces malaysiensis TaxID=92644 RepID=UPI0036ADD46B
ARAVSPVAPHEPTGGAARADRWRRTSRPVAPHEPTRHLSASAARVAPRPLATKVIFERHTEGG